MTIANIAGNIRRWALVTPAPSQIMDYQMFAEALVIPTQAAIFSMFIGGKQTVRGSDKGTYLVLFDLILLIYSIRTAAATRI